MINQLNGQHRRLEARLSPPANNDRRARTRTLIQMGALVTLSGLAENCNIEEGDDLQLDIIAMNKAAILLGFLKEALDTIPFSEANKLKWQQQGVNELKKTAAKNKLSSYKNLKKRFRAV